MLPALRQVQSFRFYWHLAMAATIFSSVKGPILVPFESGQITVVLGHTGRVAHHLMPHGAVLHCIPPTNLL